MTVDHVGATCADLLDRESPLPFTARDAESVHALHAAATAD